MSCIQVTSYINRYGPGMVIYWFGFLQSLNGHCKDVLLVNGFPQGVSLSMGPDA